MKLFNQNIDLNLYKVFYAVAENNSFSKASEQIYLSQPAVSHSINKLEEQLNMKLFYRTSRGVMLTPEAEGLFKYIKNAYDYIYLGEQHIKESKEMMCGNIKIGIPTHIGSFFLADKIQQFNEKYPNIIFSIQSRPTVEMIHMLETHKLDFIIDSSPINKTNNIDLITRKLLDVDTIFVAAKSVEERFKDIKIEDLPLILPNSNTATRKIVDAYFNKRNIKLNPIMEISTTEMTINMVKRGIGVGWIIKDILDDTLKKEIYELKVDFDLPKIEIELAYINQFVSYAAKKFIEEKVE